MHEKNLYEYAVIRVVRVEREEFLKGLLFFVKAKFKSTSFLM
jgi:hypothetical protein